MTGRELHLLCCISAYCSAVIAPHYESVLILQKFIAPRYGPYHAAIITHLEPYYDTLARQHPSCCILA